MIKITCQADIDKLTSDDIVNHAKEVFAQDWPRTNVGTESPFQVPYCYPSEIKSAFVDGYLAGMLFFKPYFTDEKSVFLFNVVNNIDPKSENIVSENNPESKE